MGFLITPSPTVHGGMVTAKLKYEGPVPPVPNDVHIDAQRADGSWHAVIGYDRIPAGMNPVSGFDVRFSTGNPNVGGPGQKTFRVRWTLDGEPIGAVEQTQVNIVANIPGRKTALKLCPEGWDCTKVLKAIADALRKRREPGQ